MPKTVHRTLPADGESLFNTEEKLFPDIKAEPGQKAFVFIHSVPYEGSVLLVNLTNRVRAEVNSYHTYMLGSLL